MSKERIFISGVAGFLGSHLAERLIGQGHAVSGCDSLEHGGDIANVVPGLDFHVCDVRNLSAVKKIVQGSTCVVHAAAMGHDGFSVHSPHLIAENIFSSTSSLLTASVQAGVRRFIYFSSMARYGAQPGGAFVEQMPCAPVTPYGIAKAAGEALVQNVARANGMEWVVAIPHNVVGPRQRFDDPYRNVVAIMINRMLRDLPPVINGDGNQVRSFTSVWDAVDVFERLIFSPAASGEIVNVGPDERPVTINEVCMLLNKVLGKDLSPIYVEPRPFEVAEAYCSAEKSKRLFGYQTKVSLEDMLVRTADWIKERGARDFKYDLPVQISNKYIPSIWRERLL